MNSEKLTEKTIEAINAARNLAQLNANSELNCIHLLSALVSQKDGVVGALLDKTYGFQSVSFVQKTASLARFWTKLTD